MDRHGDGHGGKWRGDRHDPHDDDEMPDVAPDVQAALSAALTADLVTAEAEFQNREEEVGEAPDADPAAAPKTAELKEPKSTVCAACGDGAPKYTCPRCEARSCSLACVRRHKTDGNCSGRHDVAEMVPIAKFSDKQLERDFRFVESCRRVADAAHRALPHLGFRFSFRALPPPLHALREAARKRGVLCQITSEGMALRDRNTSRYDRRRDTIVWRLEFVFHPTGAPAAAGRDFRVGTDWASERFLLRDALRHCWQMNPALPSHHIRRGYNRAADWCEPGAQKPPDQQAQQAPSDGDDGGVGGGGSGLDAGETEGCPMVGPEGRVKAAAGAAAAAAGAATPGSGTFDEGDDGIAVFAPTAPPAAADRKRPRAPTPPTPAVVAPGRPPTAPSSGPPAFGASRFSHVPLNEATAEGEGEMEDTLPRKPPTAEELAGKAAVDNFLDRHTDAVLLVQAERLGTARAFHRLDPGATVHEALRSIFFINEFPVVHVVPRAAFVAANPHLDPAAACGVAASSAGTAIPPASSGGTAGHWLLITEQQRTQIRDGFRKKERVPRFGAEGSGGGLPGAESQADGAGGPPPRRELPKASELSAEDRERMSRLPCRAFRRGRCDRPEGDCPYWHCPPEELPACRSMVLHSQCPLGPRCSFSHETEAVYREREAQKATRFGRGRGGGGPPGATGDGRGGGPAGAGGGGAPHYTPAYYGPGGQMRHEAGGRGRGTGGRGRGGRDAVEAPPMPAHLARKAIHIQMPVPGAQPGGAGDMPPPGPRGTPPGGPMSGAGAPPPIRSDDAWRSHAAGMTGGDRPGPLHSAPPGLRYSDDGRHDGGFSEGPARLHMEGPPQHHRDHFHPSAGHIGNPTGNGGGLHSHYSGGQPVHPALVGDGDSVPRHPALGIGHGDHYEHHNDRRAPRSEHHRQQQPHGRREDPRPDQPQGYPPSPYDMM